MNAIAPYRKALAAALAAAVAVILTSLVNGLPLTTPVYASAAVAALGALQLTWATPNADDDAQTQAVKLAVAAMLADVAERVRAGKHSR